MRNLLAGAVAGFSALCLAGGASAQLTVSSGSTSGVSCTAGVCAPAAAKAALNVTQLRNLLARSDVHLKSDALSQDIVIAAPVFWTSGHRLTLDGYRSITIDSPIQVAGNGALTMTTNDGGRGGRITYDPKASVTFLSLSDSLIMNGKSFTPINSIASLASAIAADPSGSFSLASSYDAKQDGTYDATPIPTEFTGTFDGLNNTISHFKLKATTGTNAGLFADLGDDGVIRNFKLLQINVKGSGRDMARVGGLVATADEGSISNVSVSGKVSGTGRYGTGGLVGSNFAAVDQAHSTVKVAGVIAGSLIGDNFTLVTDSSASGAVKTVPATSTPLIGGLAGNNDGGTIQRCFATGAVSAGSKISNAGGLLGENSGAIADSYATGAVNARKQIAGGLVGSNDLTATIDRSYSSGSVTGAKNTIIGGFIGSDGTKGLNGALTFDYWDTTTSGITDPSQGAGEPKNDPGITGLSDQALKSGLPSGFDKAVWAQSSKINGGLPYLIANPPSR